MAASPDQPSGALPSQPARLRRLASWYDERLGGYSRAAGDAIDRLIGQGSGNCLDLCCGTGVHLQLLRSLGWQVTGLDISSDQLRLARDRAEGCELVRGDATALPFRENRFDAVVSMFSHTDVDDFAMLVHEAARVLRPGATFVYVGLHPCFVGPLTFDRDQPVPTLYAGYRARGRYTEGAGISPDGLWAKVSGVHLTLEDVIGAILRAGLILDHFEEHGLDDYPRRIALRANKRR